MMALSDWQFLFLVGIILLLSYMLWRAMKKNDDDIKGLKKVAAKKMTDDDIEPRAAMYSCKSFAPDGQTLEEQTFHCAGESLKESIDGIRQLKKMSEQGSL